MRLSMWMILNRLEYLDPEVHIRENAQRTLRSAHRTYAANCVRVYPGSGGEVICEGGGDTLILRDISPVEALDMVQYVFDFYNDWSSGVLRLLEQNNYQKVIEQAWTVFHNPVMLFDANFRLLGISYDDSGPVPSGDDSTSRDFLRRVQQDSLYLINRSIREYTDRQVWNNYLDEGPCIYSAVDDNGTEHTGAVCNIFFRDFMVGRLFVLERDRKLNPGDLQAMSVLSRLVRPSMERYVNEIGAHPFYQILENKALTARSLDSLLSLYQWNRDDTFRVFVFSFPENHERHKEIAAMIRSQLAVMYPDSCLLEYRGEIVGIIRASEARDFSAYAALESLLTGSGIIVGTSIENQGIEPLAELLQQARFACDYAVKKHFSGVVSRFFYCAQEALLFSDWDAASKRAACHPGVSRLWKSGREKSSVLFDTLCAYIDQERSVSAAAKELFIHKNTLLYRLSQIYAYIPKEEFDSVYCRDYIRLSICFLKGEARNGLT